MKYKSVTKACIFEYLICIAALTIYIILNTTRSEGASAGYDILVSAVCTGVFFFAFIVFNFIKSFEKYAPYLFSTIFIANCFVVCIVEPISAFSPLIFITAQIFISFYIVPTVNLYFLALSDVAMLSFLVFFSDSIESVMPTPAFGIVFFLYNVASIASVLLIFYFKKAILIAQKRFSSIAKATYRHNAFMEAMVHEIQTPINRTNDLSVEILRNAPNEDQRSIAYEIQSVNREILSTIDNASDYMRLEAKKVRIAKDPYVFNSLLNDVVNLCSAKLSSSDIDFIVDVSPDIPYELIGDSSRISQVITNVFSNAVKFTKSGSITLSFNTRKTPYGVNLTVSIKDTGTGIDPKVADKIFTAYSDNESATHIGLGIAKQIVTLMGGFISINSKIAHGTEIRFSIPQGVKCADKFISIKFEKVCVLMYIEKFQLCEAMEKLFAQAGAKLIFCGSNSDFMLNKDDKRITHIITDYNYYVFNKPIFDILSQRLDVVVMKNPEKAEKTMLPSNIKRIFYPIYIFTLAMLFDSENDVKNIVNVNFTAKRANILVVDDSSVNIKVAFLFLKLYKATLFSAESGEEALKILAHNRIDLIFMDHLMPKPDGVETTEIIRHSNEYYSNVPIIALTANSSSETRNMFIKSGMNDMISKPVELKAIDSALRKWLPKSLIDEEENPAEILVKFSDAVNYEYLNVKQALSRIPDGKNAYADILESFYNSFKSTAGSLKRTLSEGDLSAYAVISHSVKGAASNICAFSLCEFARQLEAAAKNNELEFVKERNDELISLYEKTNLCIEKYFSDNNLELHRIIRLSDALPQIEQALIQRNAQSSYDILKHLLSFTLSLNARSLLESAIDAVDCFDFKSALESIERLKKDENGEKESL